MSLERSGEILLTAVVVSLVVHFGTMFYARPKVMTHVAPGAVRTVHRGPMRVTKAAERPEAVEAAELPEVDALRDAPAAEELKTQPAAPELKNAETPAAKAVLPATLFETSDQVKPSPDLPAFDVKPLSTDRSSLRLELPPPKLGNPGPIALAAAPAPAPLPPAPPAATPAVPVVELEPEVKPEPVAMIPAEEKKAQDFHPEQEVREKVDEKLVEKEKTAVRELLNVAEARELRKFVNAAVTRATDGRWTYFTVMFSPRHDLPVVAKDVVVLIDASGSIGKDRIRSVRESAKAILRSCTNTGDRFNLVAFRDKFTYAFRRWQECSQTSFNAADAWLDNVAAHGRTDVFETIRSVLTLPRDPKRPLIALVVTDGDANTGVSKTSDILSKFTALNDGLISVYMYGVRKSANRELIDVLTRGNRGESYIYDGWLRWSAGSGIEALGARFRDPVLSDLRLVFAAGTKAEAYPRRLKNIYRGETLEVYGRVPAGTREIAFSLKGLNAAELYEDFFKLALDGAREDAKAKSAWEAERLIDSKLR